MNKSGFITYLYSHIKSGRKNPLTIRIYVRAAKDLEEFLHDRKLTKELLSQFVRHIQDTHDTNGQQPKFGGVRHYLRFLGWDDALVKKLVPIPRAVEVKTEKDILSIADVQRLFDATDNDVLTNTLLKALYYSALRRKELVNLDIDDILFDEGVVVVRNGKGRFGQPEEILPKQEFFDAVKRYLGVRPLPIAGHEQALFIQPMNLKRMSTNVLRELMFDAQEISGVRPDIHLTPHVFRASVITHMNNAGANTTTIMQLSRHKSFDAMKRYVRPTREEKRANIKRYVPSIGKAPEPEPESKQQPPVGMFAKPQVTPFDLLKQGLLTAEQYQELMSCPQTQQPKVLQKQHLDPTYG